MPRQTMPASGIFEALERGRLDAIGVGWLPGVAKNLMAHPGADNDGVRWLAFESMSGRKAPTKRPTLVERVRAALPDRLLDDLTALRASRDDQHALCAGGGSVGRVPRRAVLPATLVAPAESGRLPLPTRQVVRHLPRRGDPGASSAPLRDDGVATTAIRTATEPPPATPARPVRARADIASTPQRTTAS